MEKVELQATLMPLGLPEVFKRIYYSLYSNSNLPRAERLSAEMTRLLFCKIYDEEYNHGLPEFRIRRDENSEQTASRIKQLFEMVKKGFPDAFDETERLHLDNRSIVYVVSQLQHFDLRDLSRDVISESFQAFLGPGMRGEKGQFFTPKNVVSLCVKMLDPKENERIVDPACGSGGFLVECIAYLGEKLDNADVKKQAFRNIFGIDKEADLSKICKAYMSIIGDGHSNIFNSDSLTTANWPREMNDKIRDQSFDVVLTNPPFGAKISIGDRSILERYKLGHKWTKTPPNDWKMTSNLTRNQAPQILFIEKCLQLLCPGGRMAIVLPDGIFGNGMHSYVLQFIFQEAKVLAVVSLAPEAFMPGTHTKTSVLFLQKKINDSDLKDYEIFMAIAYKVGHDKNGNTTYKMNDRGEYLFDKNGNRIIDDELPEVTKRFRLFMKKELNDYDHLGFTIKFSDVKNSILVPGYYDPEIKTELEKLMSTGRVSLSSIGELCENGVISVRRGHEVGSKYYGMGEVPFVRTTDIVNWEIKIDPIKSIPEEIYNSYKKRQNIREDDVLLVTDGTFLIGRTAIITPLDTKIVIQSHIRRIRCLKHEYLHPYMLLYLLNTDVVQRQIRAKTIVQATISTVGNRLFEIVLPIPQEESLVKKIVDEVKEVIKLKRMARQRITEMLSQPENYL